jgi:hypothetical protein
MTVHKRLCGLTLEKTDKRLSHQQSSSGLRAEDGIQSHDITRCHRRHASSISSIPRLPRIQILTFGLGFSDLDFDISLVRAQHGRTDNHGANWNHRRNRNALTERERREVRIKQELSGARRRVERVNLQGDGGMLHRRVSLEERCRT